jgi:asparagine synthase (glutamine-hydrolysing)
MLAAIRHRGVWPPHLSAASPACIGELGGEPHSTAPPNTRTAIAADARLDNKAELARLLRSSGSTPTHTLLLDAYAMWGEACAERLLGDFVAAIWDIRRHQLICIRDHLGIRPLYYCHIPKKMFAFASEVKALLALPGFVRRIDDASIADFLVNFRDMERTFYEDIRRLPPAHVLTVSSKGAKTLQRYWAPDPARTVSCASNAEYAQVLREIFTEAVRCRLDTRTGVGAELSGGLDSSSVTCTARYLLGERSQLSTFSLLLTDKRYGDERPFIDAVVRSGRLHHSHIDISEQSPLRHLDNVSFHRDGPSGSQLDSDFWELFSRAASQNVGVLLDGYDGDVTIFYDFRYLRELASRLRWPTVLHEVRGLSHHYFRGKASSWSLVKQYCVPAIPPSWEWLRRAKRRFGAPATERGWHSLISKRFAASSGLTDRVERYGRELTTLQTYRDSHAHLITHPSRPALYEVVDHIGAAFSIEPRHPFSDKRLVEFCLALPREQLIKNGLTRPILRRALADLLPVEVRQRGDKAGTVAPRRLARLERRVLEETAQDFDVLADYLDMARLQALTTRYLDGDALLGHPAILWPAVSLRQWLRAPNASGELSRDVT